jgi:hypothetical protein
MQRERAIDGAAEYEARLAMGAAGRGFYKRLL